ncbi:MAG: 4'-phosphopantetheinyl transferase superfamily protein, partial [Anaerovoracaceae bacterium]
VFDPVLTHEEKKRITTAPNRLAEFYRIWTIREAFAKKDGRGLAVFEQEEIRIDYENNQIFFQDKVVMVRTFLWEGHVISLCAEHLPKEIRPQFITAEEWKQKWFFS